MFHASCTFTDVIDSVVVVALVVFIVVVLVVVIFIVGVSRNFGATQSGSEQPRIGRVFHANCYIRIRHIFTTALKSEMRSDNDRTYSTKKLSDNGSSKKKCP